MIDIPRGNLPVKTGALTVKLSDVKTLSDRDRHVLRYYVRGGNKTEVRYRDEPEVRAILKPFLGDGPQDVSALHREEKPR